MAASFITSLFACPDLPPPSAAVTAAGTPIPSPTLAVFIAYALHRTRLNASVTFASLFLLQRLKARFPAARGSSGHRLFISAFMIASKIVCDDTYSNKSWCVVGQGMFSLREINQMEREMCGYLEWVLNVQQDELEAFTEKVQAEFGQTAPLATSAPISVEIPVPTFIASNKPTAPKAVPIPVATSSFPRSYPVRDTYPSPESVSSSPSHSDTTSPASSAPHTPPQSMDMDPVAQVAGSLPKMMKTGGMDPPMAKAITSKPFAFAAAAVW